MHTNSHEFALFFQGQLQKSLTITDKDLIFRIQHVLRIRPQDTLILFNDTAHASVTYLGGDKKQITFVAHDIVQNAPLMPNIHWLLPVLERDAFEAAVYSATVLGAATIQPIITEKSRQQWGSAKDLDRAKRIAIAAAEQSKQFILPAIKSVQMLVDGVLHSVGKKIFFDPTGSSCAQLICDIRGEQALVLCIGPEGDLTEKEKAILKNNEFQFYSLTPTILRACDAVLVAQGIIRSIL